MTWVRWVAISRRRKKRCKLSINLRLICLVWIVWVNITFLTGHHHSSGNLGIFVVVLSWSNTQVLLQPSPRLLMLPSHQYKWELCFSNQGSPKTNGCCSGLQMWNWIGSVGSPLIVEAGSSVEWVTSNRICPSGSLAVTVWVFTWSNLICHSLTWVSVRLGHAGAIFVVSVLLIVYTQRLPGQVDS